MNLMDMIKPVEETKSESKEKRVAAKKTESKKTESKKADKVFKYPFEIYLAAEKKDVSYIFEEGVEYAPEQITKKMLEHGFYEFSGNVTYDFIEKDNVLVPTFQQHKKG
ncbi:hypothetical protein [Amedibacillus dolichus]|uniref:Uncharacterized protein n=1 Tax=Amedibacillus dolichus DSM 3991 TaxID=428127 RepID=A8RC19_9FIRM|nr:hypothetical protein [Amedibacillus dolichus]EDP11323.1 hypothetical protein EUBDOL_01243 [Amedibacillus dolichus DSM 3991]